MSISSDGEAAVCGLGAWLVSMCMGLLVRHGHAWKNQERRNTSLPQFSLAHVCTGGFAAWWSAWTHNQR